ncbi:hypothetical protein HK405_000587 [Cladochytrium tenue]|nr:hypothetical protein HK405_000587 [Cladochytrium tenue]
MTDLLREHQEELENFKHEHLQSMDGESELGSGELSKAAQFSSQELPPHALAEFQAGRTLTPVRMAGVTVFALELPALHRLMAAAAAAATGSQTDGSRSNVGGAAALAAVQRALLAAVAAVDDLVATMVRSDEDMFRVRAGAGMWIVAAGVNQNSGGSDEARRAAEVARKVVELVQEAVEMQFDDVELEGLEGLNGGCGELQLRAGVATGNVIGGLMGGKESHYVLVGDAVTRCLLAVREAAEGAVSISKETAKLVAQAIC